WFKKIFAPTSIMPRHRTLTDRSLSFDIPDTHILEHAETTKPQHSFLGNNMSFLEVLNI
ncbi:hypothetical protein L9F63_000057, partial [Diploptera punctata]